MFTQNRFCAAPVLLCRRNLDAGGEIRALVINTGIANAGTGEPGLQAAQDTCEAVTGCLGRRIRSGIAFLDRRDSRTVAGQPADRRAAALCR